MPRSMCSWMPKPKFPVALKLPFRNSYSLTYVTSSKMLRFYSKVMLSHLTLDTDVFNAFHSSGDHNATTTDARYLYHHPSFNSWCPDEPRLANPPQFSPPSCSSKIFGEQVAQVVKGSMLFLSPKQQCQTTERNSKALTPISGLVGLIFSSSTTGLVRKGNGHFNVSTRSKNVSEVQNCKSETITMHQLTAKQKRSQ